MQHTRTRAHTHPTYPEEATRSQRLWLRAVSLQDGLVGREERPAREEPEQQHCSLQKDGQKDREGDRQPGAGGHRRLAAREF